MPWGISNKAPDIEKVKARVADSLNGMNSCGEIDYLLYCRLYDLMDEAVQKAYVLGKRDSIIPKFLRKRK